jgi:hypothetical protein
MIIEYKELYECSQEELNHAFIQACANGDLKKISYLLTSPELPIHANIHASKDQGFITACECKRTEVAKYLLSSTELKEHANLHAQGDTPFYKSMCNKNYELIEFFIFEHNLQRDESIRSYLNIFPKKEEDIINKMFEVRDLNNQLQNASNCQAKDKRPKI